MKALCISIAVLCSFTGQSQSTFTVRFDFNKYNITATALSQLDSFLQAEKQHLPSLLIQLNGHCDAIGSDEYNNKLSKQRVAAIKKYFLNNGVAPANIGDEIGRGKKEPLNENSNEEERQLNRRVEISFLPVIITNPPEKISLKEKIGDTATTAGTNIVLRNINFFGGMHQFLSESTPMLEELLDAMQTYPKLVIRIEGHICCEQFAGDGLDAETGVNNLSEARAKAVIDYLINNNIAAKRVSYKGFGHTAPIYAWPEKTEEERSENRRVEIKIISK